MATNLPMDKNPVASDPLPFFITQPGQTDVLFIVVVLFLISAILFVGNIYLQLHSVPGRMAQGRSRVQLEIVAVLALIALLTQQNILWIAALLLALVDFPDLSTPIISMAQSLEKLSSRRSGEAPVSAVVGGDTPPSVAEDVADETAANS